MVNVAFIRCSEVLPVKITDEVYREKAEELVARMSDNETMLTAIARAQAQANSLKESYKETMRENNQEISSLRYALKEGSVASSVECVKIIDSEAGMVYFRRLDDNTIVKNMCRKATVKEMEELPLSDISEETLAAEMYPNDEEAAEIEKLLNPEEKVDAVEEEF